jgi:hypothetical protein
MLITTRVALPELDVRAEETIRWTPEAEKRMENVPPQVKGIARTAIFRLAVEKGHSVITSDLLDEAMDRFMPKASAKATTRLAESLVLEQAKGRSISICKQCGVAASESEAVKCGVCGGVKFQVVSPEVVEEVIKMEGGLAEETTYDGRKLQWTQDAKRALRTMTDAYTRRRTKARVEKSARMRRMKTITLDFARAIVEDETGKPLVLGPEADQPGRPAEKVKETTPVDDGKKLIARDAKNNPLVSSYEWTEDAVKRVLRVPAGFMRNKTQDRIEELAAEREVETIDLAVVEDGIEMGRQMMASMIQTYQANPETARQQSSTAPSNDDKTGPALNEAGLMGGVGSMQTKTDDA